MKQFQPYEIEFLYEDDLRPRLRNFFAASPGHAFQKCLKRFPGAKLLGGFRWGRLLGVLCRITYSARSPAKVEPLPATKAQEQTFPFFDECINFAGKTGTPHQNKSNQSYNE